MTVTLLLTLVGLLELGDDVGLGVFEACLPASGEADSTEHPLVEDLCFVALYSVLSCNMYLTSLLVCLRQQHCAAAYPNSSNSTLEL